jgi:hypothetical protein
MLIAVLMLHRGNSPTAMKNIHYTYRRHLSWLILHRQHLSWLRRVNGLRNCFCTTWIPVTQHHFTVQHNCQIFAVGSILSHYVAYLSKLLQFLAAWLLFEQIFSQSVKLLESLIFAKYSLAKTS